ncbi:MAG: F0F1 ATP synthase subunit epsilon [Microbacteriaceae bacterium]|jgi:F-type H+-transporting ATPase subunit epsilon|nr:F0F1 ATP synthase subunit epsilon [Microbacteriaceae bacterium]MDR9443771.1 F0F1 ATP synthase subunit epsilon [Microbacteriaceae bacterium]
MSDNQMQVNIVAADHEVWSGEAKLVIAKTIVGEIGLMPGHEPMLAILGAGEIRVSGGSDDVTAKTEMGGFLSMENNQVTVVMRDGGLDS